MAVEDFKEWRIIDSHPERSSLDIHCGYEHVAYLLMIKGREEQQRRNATLIIAAKDLLRACESAMRIVDLWGPIDVPDHVNLSGEMSALSAMKHGFEAAISKARTVNIVRTAQATEPPSVEVNNETLVMDF